MGAEMDFETYDEKPTQDDYNDLIAGRQYSDGHGGYSGTFAEAAGTLKFHHEKKDDAAAAEEWLNQNCQKWEPGIAVEFTSGENETKWLVGACCSS